MLTFDIQFTKEEYVRSRRSILMKTHFRWFDPILCAALIAFGAYRWFSGTIEWFHFIFIAVGLIYFLVFGLAMYVMPGIVFSREEKLRMPYKVSIAPEQVVYESPDGRAEYQWSFYKKAAREKDFYYLIYGSQLAHTIPRRVFASEEQVKLFEDLVRTKVKDSF